MKRIPENRILAQSGYSDSYKDIVESFNLDLSSNYGATRATRTKLLTDDTDVPELTLPIAFTFYDSRYWALANSYIFEGGSSPSDPFTR